MGAKRKGDRELVRQMWDEGYSSATIAKVTGYTPSYIRHLASNEGWKARRVCARPARRGARPRPIRRDLTIEAERELFGTEDAKHTSDEWRMIFWLARKKAGLPHTPPQEKAA